MRDLGVYIHIPFCKSKCSYCDFISFSNINEKCESYINALSKEIELFNLKSYNLTSIYIGGGTPSYINENYISGILKKFNIPKKIEVTIEVNPGTVDEQKLTNYFNSGVNRLSIGLQSSNNNILKSIGRIHTYEEFLETFRLAKKVGFKNINVDLMLGLPGQTLDDLKETVDKIKQLDIQHISIYSLILEEGTNMYARYQKGELILPSEDIEREMYWYVKRELKDSGFEHYEISNFGKKDYKSVHNYDCWEQKEYKGFGIAAHSYIDNKRFCNIDNIDLYVNNIKESNINANIVVNETQTTDIKMNEYMILGLRKLDGADIVEFKNKFNVEIGDVFEFKLKSLIGKGLIERKENKILLTNKGIDLANLVWEEFI